MVSSLYLPVVETGEEMFMVDTAVTREEKAEGLMGVESLENDQGMIFYWEDEAERVFWMKNTEIPLDMLFVDENLEVINLERADPEPRVPEFKLDRYRSEEPAQFVVEVPQGSVSREIEGKRLEIRKWRGETGFPGSHLTQTAR